MLSDGWTIFAIIKFSIKNTRMYDVHCSPYINVVLFCMYIGQSIDKCLNCSRAAPHRQDESDKIPNRNKSKFKNEVELLSRIKIIFNFRGPQKKCLGTEWLSVSSIFCNSGLNFHMVSTFRILLFKLFHIVSVDGIKKNH